VQNSSEVDLALIAPYDHRRRDMERALRKTAKPHAPTTLSRLRTVPGIGESLSRVLLYEIHDIQRFPRVQECVSYGRRVTGATESAGKRAGTSGATMGNAYRSGAFAAAPVLFWRAHPAGQKSLGRREKKHRQGQALTILAPTFARAVYDR
jgi:transposase